jgi:hypothetical protein
MPPSEGVNPGDFEIDDLNMGRDGHVAPYHRLELRGAISSLPLSLLWPRALLRADPRVGFLSTTQGQGHGGLLSALSLGVVGLPGHIMA